MQGLKSAILDVHALTGIQKLFLLWVPMNSYQAWKAKLEKAYSFRVQSGVSNVLLEAP